MKEIAAEEMQYGKLRRDKMLCKRELVELVMVN